MSKKRKSESIGVRVPPEVKENLQKGADSRNETLSQTIRMILILGVDQMILMQEAYDRARQTVREKELNSLRCPDGV